MAKTSAFFEDPFRTSKRIGGRWLIIVQRQDDTILFTDPAGLRQVYYTDIDVTKQIHCASEPGLLQKICGFTIDPEAESFQHSPGFQANSEYWWPGDKSCFREVKRLLPNFFLDSSSGVCKRFWPVKPFKHREKVDVIKLLSKRLPSFMDAISRRGRVAVAITAGLDSRMVLASCKPVLKQLEFMTVKQDGMADSHPDLQIPRIFADNLGFNHKIVGNESNNVRNTFRRSYKDSILHFHEKWLPDAQSIYDAYNQEAIIVVGSMAETGRLYYKSSLPAGKQLTSAQLASAANLGSHPFAIDAFADWLHGAENTFNYNLADLFYWEQRAGRWMATSQLEFGTVWRDIFAPFNSREILECLLSADEEIRCAPDYELFNDLIACLWPELLSQPINPHQMTQKSNLAIRLAKKIWRNVHKLSSID
jgi:hypothetical protein